MSAANSTKGGGIPSELGDLLSLEVLFLGENNFDEWYLPDFFQDMSKLTELSLRSSSLVWVVPHWIGELTGLQVSLFGIACLSCTLLHFSFALITRILENQLLDLGDNDLTGTVPSEIEDLSNLVVLFLDGNRFKGDIDSAGFQGLPSIDVLRVQNNEFTGDAIEVCRRGMSRFVSDCGSAPGKSDGEVSVLDHAGFSDTLTNSSSAMTRIMKIFRLCVGAVLHAVLTTKSRTQHVEN